jgi:hypothetical protein
MPLSKKQLSEKKEIMLEENVRLLRSGAWGYIHKKKAIFQSMNAETCNSFSNWVFAYSSWADVNKIEKKEIQNAIISEALNRQQSEPKIQILPKCHLCDAPHWYAGSNNYEAVVRQQSLMTNK